MAERTDSRQREMDFGGADAAHVGRWNDISTALSRVGTLCDLHLSRFVRMVFDMTQGGTSGSFSKSYRALSERPAWLCCSQRKARTTVELSVDLGFVILTKRRSRGGSQQENSYAINWTGIHAINAGTGGTTRHTHGTTCHGGGTTRHTHGTTCHHNKEKKLYRSFIEENSDTGPGTDPNPRMDSNSKSQTLADKLCEGSPILSAAKERRIAPLPPGDLVHGCFACLKEDHLRAPLGLVTWHRKQLSTPEPLMAATEADLLLTIATAIYATSVPKEDVRKNRVALFNSTIKRRAFTRSLPYVPKARMLLDQGVAERGLQWAGLADEPMPAEVTV